MIARTKALPKQTAQFDPSLYDDKCVSEICECGRHRCPPSDLNYEARFQQPILPKSTFKKCDCRCKTAPKKKCRCKCKQKGRKQYVYQQRHYDPSAIQTVYQMEFQGKYVEPDQLTRVTGNGNVGLVRHGTNAPFIGTTQYNTQFVGKIAEPDFRKTKSGQNVNLVHPRPPFEGVTTYNTSYQGKYVERQNLALQKRAPERPYVPFDATSEYNSKYQYVAVEDGGQCESCCDCAVDQCSNCCDCQDVDSLDQINTNPKYHSEYKHEATRTTVNKQSVYPQQPPLQKIQNQQVECPIKKLPPAPGKCSPGKTHVKFAAKKNFWK